MNITIQTNPRYTLEDLTQEELGAICTSLAETVNNHKTPPAFKEMLKNILNQINISMEHHR